MDAATLEKRYLRVTKKFAKLAGFWPDQKKSTRCILSATVYIVSGICVVGMISRIVCFYSIDYLLGQSPFIFAAVLLFLKHANYTVNSKKLQNLLNTMYQDWREKRSKEENDIMTSYAERGAFFSTFYLVNAYICCFLFVQIPWTGKLINIIKHSNSTELLYVIPVYYFVDEHKYYYLVIAHSSVTMMIVVIVYVSCDTSYMLVVHHACGLLAVAGHRFKVAIHDVSLKNDEKEDRKIMREAYAKVSFSVRAHIHALAYLREIEGAHMGYLFICIGLVILCFSITLVKVVTMERSLEFYKYASFLLCQLMHLFYLMVQGQFVIDTTDDIYQSIYEALWYKGSSEIQMLYVLALRRTLTHPRLTAGGLVNLNMQSFSEVIKLSVSYYTVIRST